MVLLLSHFYSFGSVMQFIRRLASTARRIMGLLGSVWSLSYVCVEVFSSLRLSRLLQIPAHLVAWSSLRFDKLARHFIGRVWPLVYSKFFHLVFLKNIDKLLSPGWILKFSKCLILVLGLNNLLDMVTIFLLKIKALITLCYTFFL